MTSVCQKPGGTHGALTLSRLSRQAVQKLAVLSRASGFPHPQ
jgi:hypothetical protein